MRRNGIVIAVLGAASLCAQAPRPLDKEGVLGVINSLKAVPDANRRAGLEGALVTTIRKWGLSFPVPPETYQELRNAGASAAVLSAASDAQLTAKELFPAQPAGSAISKDVLLRVIEVVGQQKTPAERFSLEQGVAAYLRGKRTDFAVTEPVEQELRGAGAGAALIAAVRDIQVTPADLLDAAQADLEARRLTQAISEAESAASLQPSLRAYQLIGRAKAEANDIEGSHAASLKVIAAGGEVAIPVLLAPPGENFRKTCDAKLTIGFGRVTLSPSASDPACAASEIHAVSLVAFGPNDYVGKDRQAYHILVQPLQGNLVNLSLAPVSGGNKWALEVLGAAAGKP